jgi:hypothetical protein
LSDKHPTPSDDERLKSIAGRLFPAAETEHERHAKLLEIIQEGALKSVDAAFRAALLINGGAAISVLAFVGGLVAQNRIHLGQLNEVASSLMFFAFGVVAAAIAMILSYFTIYAVAVHQYSYVLLKEFPYFLGTPRGKFWALLAQVLRISAALVGVSSLVLFVIGMFYVRNAILTLPA